MKEMEQHIEELETLLLEQSKARASYFRAFLLNQYPGLPVTVTEMCDEGEHQDGLGFYDQYIEETEEKTLLCLMADFELYAKESGGTN